MSSNEKSGVPANDEWKNSLHKITAELNTLLKNQQADSEANSGPGRDPVQKLQQLTEHIKEGAKNGKIDVTKVLVGAFKGLDGQHIVEDVYNMTDHANSLATSFAKAHALLVKIDGHNYKRADGTLVKYADKWNGYHDDFKILLTDSKNIASAGVCYTQRYAKEVPEKLAKLQSIIDDPRTENEEIHETRKRAEKTLKLLEATINILINDMTDTQSRATILGSKLNTLSNNIGIFAADLEKDIDTILGTVDKDIVAAQTHVNNCQRELDELQKTLDNSYTSLYASAGSTAGSLILGCAAGLACASVIVPAIPFVVAGLAFLSIMGSGVATSVYKGQVYAADQKLKTAKEKLQNLKNLRGDLVKSKEDVKLIKADTDNIIKRLAKMMTIWNTIQSDAVQLKEWLSGCLKPDVPAETVASYLSDNNIGKIYDILGQVLQVYASRVTAAGA